MHVLIFTYAQCKQNKYIENWCVRVCVHACVCVCACVQIFVDISCISSLRLVDSTKLVHPSEADSFPPPPTPQKLDIMMITYMPVGLFPGSLSGYDRMPQSMNYQCYWCTLTSLVRFSCVGWHIRDKLRPMPKPGSVLLYIHGNHKVP